MCTQRTLKLVCTCAQSDHNFRYPHEDTLHPWLFKMCRVKILIRLRKAQADQNLRLAHVRRYILINVAAHVSSID